MSNNGIFQILLFLFFLFILVKPLGLYMARVYQGKPTYLDWLFGPIERTIYRLCGIKPQLQMDWKSYLIAMLCFNLLGIFAVYGLQRLQAFLPLNPEHFPVVSPTVAFNTAASYVTNTNWQAYGGETTMSYLTQMLALTVQNFLSAATGIALLMALIRGLICHEGSELGNFWVDLVRGTLYILLPLAMLFAIFLSSQGVLQNFKSYERISVLQPSTYVPFTQKPQQIANIKISEQVLPMGPVASQVAIKQLGSNGGGFFNTNSAHPFENPTPVTNFFEMLAILLIPAALCYSFGVMIKDRRQGWALLITMFLMLFPLILCTAVIERHGNPAFTHMNINQKPKYFLAGGNMEGKEVRFGPLNSALWAISTTATSNGSVNSMHDSYMPLSGMFQLWLMHIGEVIFGGVGSGLYSMLLVVIMTVFVAGLMVGRSPEYLGKKIEPYEMKMASIGVLLMPLIVLLLTGVGVISSAGTSSIGNPGAHGFTEILYAFTSMGNNNGSAYAGLNASTPFYTIVGGLEMLLLRYWIAIPTLAIAGSLARKKIIPSSAGTLPTHTPQFVILLLGVIFIIGALTFFPALALGPIVDQLTLWNQYGH